jgi:protein arginine kinase activator
MKKCDNCDKPATVHVTEVVGGEKIEKHLCEDCASSEGITMKADIPISKLLEDFILQGKSSEGEEAETETACDVCGITFKDFRKHGRLGCPNDYDLFRDRLLPILQRAHEGATEHVGKVPHRAGDTEKKHNRVLRLRAELKTAIAAEQYERAAALRDQIREYESL